MILGVRVEPSPPPLGSPQQARAVANALWPDLRRNKWRAHTIKEAHAPTGNPRTGKDYATSSSFPNARAWELQPNPGPDTLTREPHIITYVWPEDWPEGAFLLVQLLQSDYIQTLTTLTPEQRFDLAAAKTGSNCRQPFHLDKNRHGQARLRRNDADGLITPAAAEALEAIAGAASISEQTKAVADALITDADIDLDALDRLEAELREG